MKLRATIMSIILLLSLCACSAKTETPSAAASETAGGSNTYSQNKKRLLLLFIYEYDKESHPLYKMAQAFMAEYPGTEIEIDCMSYSGATVKRLKQQISNANDKRGPDLIDMRRIGSLTIADIFKPADFNELMEADLNFSRDDYFTNIFDAMTSDGVMNQMPLQIYYDQYSLNKKYESLLDKPFNEYETINFSQMMDIYDRAKMLELASGKRQDELLLYLVCPDIEFTKPVLFAGSDGNALFRYSSNLTVNYPAASYGASVNTCAASREVLDLFTPRRSAGVQASLPVRLTASRE